MSFEKKRVNIVERPGWKPYDPGGQIMNWASDNAWDEFSHMSKEDLLGRMTDMIGKAKPGPLEWSPRKLELTEEDYDLIWEELKEGVSDKLEAARLSILDALQWMWEEAYMPDDGDLDIAMDRTAERIVDTYSIDTSLWEPLLERAGYDERKVLESLMEGVTYEHEEHHYDRFIVFYFGAAEAVKKLLKIVYADPEELSEKFTVEQLKTDFEAMAEDYMDIFFDKLAKVMGDTNASNRTDFKKHWKVVLSDKAQINIVVKQVKEFLTEVRAKKVEE